MKYMLMICPEPKGFEPSDESAAVIDEHVKFARDAIARGAYVTCDALQGPESAHTVRVVDGEPVITDGPFAETKELLGGFYLFECKDDAEATAYATRLATFTSCTIEVRPIQVIDGWEEMIGLAHAAAR
ncbi:MAG TPA: YciI family protein [Dehalococcoidia bacterium]|jgi:hypothetical protein